MLTQTPMFNIYLSKFIFQDRSFNFCQAHPWGPRWRWYRRSGTSSVENIKELFFDFHDFWLITLCKYLILYFSFRGKLKFFSYDVRNDEKDCNFKKDNFGFFGKVAFTVNIWILFVGRRRWKKLDLQQLNRNFCDLKRSFFYCQYSFRHSQFEAKWGKMIFCFNVEGIGLLNDDDVHLFVLVFLWFSVNGV